MSEPDPRTAALEKALTAEIVEIEEERLLIDCIADTCGHPDGECPDPPGVNCGDGKRLAAAILAALDATGWELTAKVEPEQILVFDADHHRVVGFVTFGVGDGFIHSHDGFGFHSHEEAP
jgi:hypothetical protein